MIGSERGFTLIELMVAVVVGMIVVLVAFSLLDTSIALTGKVTDRTDSAQRARVAMDAITRELRSQVCMTDASGNPKPSITYGDPYQVTFQTYTGNGTGNANGVVVPEQHTLVWNSANNSIVDQRFVGTGTPPNVTYPSTPTSTRTILTDVFQEPTRPPSSNGVPIFQYYGFPASGAVAPTNQLPATLGASDYGQVARVAIKFQVNPTRSASSAQSTTIEDDVVVRTWDPNGASGAVAPQCA